MRSRKYMHREYAAIVEAGFVLQVDCPDLALHDIWFPELSVVEVRAEICDANIAALNRRPGWAPNRGCACTCVSGAGERPLVQRFDVGQHRRPVAEAE